MTEIATRRSILPDPFPLSVQEIVGLLASECRSPVYERPNDNRMITAVSRPDQARLDSLSFYLPSKHITPPSAGVCLVQPARPPETTAAWLPLSVESPKNSFFTLLDFLYPRAGGDDWSLVTNLQQPQIASDAQIDKTAVIADGVVIESDCVIGPHVTIGPGCYLRRGTICEPQVVLSCTQTGRDVIIKSGSVIGSQGFGFYFNQRHQRLQTMPHLGGVVIGNRVQIGACVCVDRGVLGPTSIGDNTVIGNHVQIGHNSEIETDVAILSFTALGGSTQIKKGATLMGGVKTIQYSVIGRNATVLCSTSVIRPVPDGETHAGHYNVPARLFHRMYTAVKNLQTDKIARER